MKKILPLGLIAGSTALFAGSLDGKIGDISTQVQNSQSKLEIILKVVAYIIGVGVILWGLYELFIAEDAQKQGKKVHGALKIVGGGFLVALPKVISWLSS